MHSPSKTDISENKDQITSCPVCSKGYPTSQIESHVDRCLFLSSSNNTSDSKYTKRRSEEKEAHFFTKKPRGERKEFGVNVEASGSRTIHFDPSNSKDDTKSVAAPQVAIEGSIPLAEQMRPSSFQEYIGQSHVLGQSTILRSLLNREEIPSMILWGPPGCGKTSLAHIISKQCKSTKQQLRFVKLSATMAGVSDVKDAVKIAKNELASFKRRTILFMDEIHRFNKLQQDIFLPHVENGCIILIGATTENPSFSLNSALLSRCRVFVLEKLGAEDIIKILASAAERLSLEIVNQDDASLRSHLSIDKEAVEWLADVCDGDARIALNSLQMALKTCSQSDGPARIVLADIQEGIKRSHLLYDRKGEEHYNIISAMHKSIRASDDNAALYWLARMLEGGEDPVYIARRLVVCASEDIGLEDSNALTLAMSAMQACKLIGMPECGLFLAHIATYLSRAPKSREVYDALNEAKRCVRDHKGALPSVPLHLRNAPTKLMKQLGYGAGYNMQDKDSSNLTYMPAGMEDIDFFERTS